jgi:hypothetical protein
MNRFKNGSDDGTNSGTYCNNYPGNNYSSVSWPKKRLTPTKFLSTDM